MADNEMSVEQAEAAAIAGGEPVLTVPTLPGTPDAGKETPAPGQVTEPGTTQDSSSAASGEQPHPSIAFSPFQSPRRPRISVALASFPCRYAFSSKVAKKLVVGPIFPSVR